MNENLNLLIKKNQNKLAVKDEVMQNVLINKRVNINVKMQDDNYMILSVLSILISKLRNQF